MLNGRVTGLSWCAEGRKFKTSSRQGEGKEKARVRQDSPIATGDPAAASPSWVLTILLPLPTWHKPQITPQRFRAKTNQTQQWHMTKKSLEQEVRMKTNKPDQGTLRMIIPKHTQLWASTLGIPERRFTSILSLGNNTLVMGQSNYTVGMAFTLHKVYPGWSLASYMVPCLPGIISEHRVRSNSWA